MSISLETRKPIDQLTVEDLEAFPIWEFAIDEEGVEGQDETWVRPLNVSRIPNDAWSLSVAADFVSPNGSTHMGIVDVSTADDCPCPSACLIAPGVYLYIDGSLDPGDWRALAEEIGGTEEELLPLRYVLRVLVDGEDSHRTGEIG